MPIGLGEYEYDPVTGGQKFVYYAPSNVGYGEGDYYTVQPGDSYESIARRVYGNERMFAELLAANSGAFLKAGMRIALPPKVANPFVSNELAAERGMATSGGLADLFKANTRDAWGRLYLTPEQQSAYRTWAYNRYYGNAPALENGRLPSGWGAEQVSGTQPPSQVGNVKGTQGIPSQASVWQGHGVTPATPMINPQAHPVVRGIPSNINPQAHPVVQAPVSRANASTPTPPTKTPTPTATPQVGSYVNPKTTTQDEISNAIAMQQMAGQIGPSGLLINPEISKALSAGLSTGWTGSQAGQVTPANILTAKEISDANEYINTLNSGGALPKNISDRVLGQMAAQNGVDVGTLKQYLSDVYGAVILPPTRYGPGGVAFPNQTPSDTLPSLEESINPVAEAQSHTPAPADWWGGLWGAENYLYPGYYNKMATYTGRPQPAPKETLSQVVNGFINFYQSTG